MSKHLECCKELSKYYKEYCKMCKDIGYSPVARRHFNSRLYKEMEKLNKENKN